MKGRKMSKFKKAIKKKELESALAKHPLRELSEDVKKDYVKGLVFVAIEDENFSSEEKEYIVSLMKNIGVDETFLDEFEAFAKEPGEDEIMEFMDRLKAFDEDIKVNFLIEVIVISFKDGEFDESEQEMFNDYIEMLELEDKKADIEYIAMALVNKDVDLALSLYTAKKEFFNKYDYMFDMLDIDIEKELKELYNWEWVEFRLEHGTVENNNLVASKPINARQFCIFLNSSIMSGNLKQVINTTKFEYDNIEIISSLDKVNLDFANDLFEYEESNSDIVGIETESSNFFCIFVNSVISTNTRGLKIIANNDSISLDESAKGFLTDNYEFFTAYIGYKNQGNKIRYIDVNSTDYSYFNRENCALESGTNYTFRVMKVEE
jgi:uncharacterized tellurite resistance protein B-like protein